MQNVKRPGVHDPASRPARPVQSLSNQIVPKVRKHKIVLESVTQEKKKLRSVLTFEAKAPVGYTFIPAGNPQLTNALKDIARKEGVKIFAVTTTPHQNVHNLSQQVHRIGFHFPNAVIDSVCRKYGIRLTSKGTVVGDGNFDSFGNGLHNSEPEKDQLTINTEARDAIRDLFPNIPDNDLFQIIKTAFQKGQRKVGTANELPLARRAQLAVVAHIRHIYTDYDKLLRSGSYHDARGIVEVPTLDKLMEWRGDDENGTKELEDVIREVVVISDEEDSDDDDVEDQGRDNSVEVISSNAIADQVQTRPVDFSNSHSTEAEDSHHHLSDEAPSGFRYIPQVARRKAVPDKRKEDRRGFSRYQAWNQAKERLRRVPNDNRQPPLPAHQIVGRLRDPTSDLAGETASQDFLPAPQERNTYSSHLTPLPSDHRSTIAQLDNRRPFYSDHLIDQSRYGRRLVSGDENMQPARRSPPTTIRTAGGALFERIPPYRHPEPRLVHSPIHSPTTTSHPIYHAEKVRSYDPNSGSQLRRYGSAEPPKRRASIVLPSIETDNPSSPHQRPSAGIRLESSAHKRHSDGAAIRYHTPPTSRPIDDLSGRVDVIDLTNSSERPVAKRRRVDPNSFIDHARAEEALLLSGRYGGSATKNWPEPSIRARENIPRLPSPSLRFANEREYQWSRPGEDDRRRTALPPNRLREAPLTARDTSFLPLQRDSEVVSSALPLRHEAESRSGPNFHAHRSVANAPTSTQFPTTFSSKESFPSLARKPGESVRSDDAQVLIRPQTEVRPIQTVHSVQPRYVAAPRYVSREEPYLAKNSGNFPRSQVQVGSQPDAVGNSMSSRETLTDLGPADRMRSTSFRPAATLDRGTVHRPSLPNLRRSISPQSRPGESSRYQVLAQSSAFPTIARPLQRHEQGDPQPPHRNALYHERHPEPSAGLSSRRYTTDTETTPPQSSRDVIMTGNTLDRDQLYRQPVR